MLPTGSYGTVETYVQRIGFLSNVAYSRTYHDHVLLTIVPARILNSSQYYLIACYFLSMSPSGTSTSPLARSLLTMRSQRLSGLSDSYTVSAARGSRSRTRTTSEVGGVIWFAPSALFGCLDHILLYFWLHIAGIAQLGEQQTEVLEVACSIHAPGTVLTFLFPPAPECEIDLCMLR